VRLILRRALPEIDETSTALYFGAVTEVATNAIEAHIDASVDDPVEIRVQGLTGSEMVEVRDRGEGFDTRAVVVPMGDDSGFGLTIARSVCPDLVIESTPRGTTVQLPFPQLVEP